MTRLLIIAALTVLCFCLASCGSKNIGAEPFPALTGAREAAGVTLGGFEVIRHNAAGNPDASLNGTLGLRLEDGALVISVDDSERTSAVTLDIKYDGTALHPERAEFSGLLGEPTQVLSLAVLDHAGRIGLGEAAIGSYVPGALHGDFATVYYTAGPARQASVMGSYAHSNPAGVAEVIREVPNLVAASDTGAGTASVSWTAGWHIADGDANSEVNSADIVPIAQKFGLNTATDWSSVQTDYDRNTETGAPDLQPIAVYYTNGTSEYLVQASDDTAGASRSAVATLDFVTAQHPKTTPLTSGNLRTVYPWYEVAFTGTSAFTYAALTALDANANGMARIWITPRFPAGTTTDGVASSIDVAVGEPEPETDITNIELSLPAGVTLEQSGSNYIVLLTERGVDDIAGNAEAFTYESLALQATVTTDPAADPALTGEDLIWTITTGNGLAEVSTATGEKGLLTFVDRGLVTVEARAPGSFTVKDSISFLLLSIDSLALELAAGGTGPVNVEPGSTVAFAALGTFAVETGSGPVTKTLDITPYVGWGVLNPAEAPYSIDTGTGELSLVGTPGGTELNVTCEFPPTEVVTLYDNQRRASNFIKVTTTF